MIYFTSDIMEELEKQRVSQNRIMRRNADALQDAIEIIAAEPCFENHLYSEDKWLDIINKSGTLCKILFGKVVPFKNWNSMVDAVNEKQKSGTHNGEIYEALDDVRCSAYPYDDNISKKCFAAVDKAIDCYIYKMQRFLNENNVEFELTRSNGIAIHALEEYFMNLIESNWCKKCLLNRLKETLI